MSAYPHRYGNTDRARQHYAIACVASARILRSEGLPEQAADLEAEARHACSTHLEQPDATTDRGTAPGRGVDEQVPQW